MRHLQERIFRLVVKKSRTKDKMFYLYRKLADGQRHLSTHPAGKTGGSFALIRKASPLPFLSFKVSAWDYLCGMI